METKMILTHGVSADMSLHDGGHVLQNQNELKYQTFSFKEGQQIFTEGENLPGLYFVESGVVKVTVNRSQHRGRTTSDEYITKLVSGGDFFGYKATIKNSVSQATAVALKPTVVRMYAKEDIKKLIDNANPLIQVLLKQAVHDIENYEQISQLHYLASVQERIAYQLVILAQKFGAQTAEGISLHLKLSRGELAQLASTINESLSRHLTEFKNEGIIDINGKEIIIKDMQRLMMKSGNFQQAQATI